MKLAPHSLAAALFLIGQRVDAQLTAAASHHAPASDAVHLVAEDAIVDGQRKLQDSEEDVPMDALKSMSMSMDGFINNYQQEGGYKHGYSGKSEGYGSGKSGKGQQPTDYNHGGYQGYYYNYNGQGGYSGDMYGKSDKGEGYGNGKTGKAGETCSIENLHMAKYRLDYDLYASGVYYGCASSGDEKSDKCGRRLMSGDKGRRLSGSYSAGGYVGPESAGLRFERPGMHEYEGEGEGEGEGSRLRKLHNMGSGAPHGYYNPKGVMEARYCSPTNAYPVRMVAVQTSPVMDGVIMIRIVPDQVNTGYSPQRGRKLYEMNPEDFVLEGGFNCKTGELTIGYTDHTPEEQRPSAKTFKNIGHAYTSYNARWSPDLSMTDEGCLCGNHQNKCRRLGELETVPGQRLLGHVTEQGGDLAGKVASKDDVLPEKACDTLKEYVADLYDSEEFPQVGTVPRDGENFPKEEVYTIELDGETLIDLIGKDATEQLVSFFDETMLDSKGDVQVHLPITKIHLQVAKNGDLGQSISHHKDDESTLLIFLTENDDSFVGGNLDYLTEDGHVTFEVKKGRGVAHGPNTVHGAKQWFGDRYVLSLGSDGMDSDCMIRSLLE